MASFLFHSNDGNLANHRQEKKCAEAPPAIRYDAKSEKITVVDCTKLEEKQRLRSPSFGFVPAITIEELDSKL